MNKKVRFIIYIRSGKEVKMRDLNKVKVRKLSSVDIQKHYEEFMNRMHKREDSL